MRKIKKIVFKKTTGFYSEKFPYTVKKLMNMTQPEVGSTHKVSVVNNWIDNPDVQVEIVEK